ncbi:hypothetical protein B0T25DRAFT_628074 [Lasiosphaeria hispida]|uniref:Uncharacterized protein n=1 Tax=Lasiosphaeria hispida TaxID=260671 RepID=A0AAJ0HWW1_9PEZI|nr:hypothetical protein B0T25DRAFT_628074 [Lasiosphaeria hispida]
MSELKATIPALKGENNLDAWPSIIRFHLRYDGLAKYIDEDVKAPVNMEIEAKKAWTRECIRAVGWDVYEGNPFKTWKLVRGVIKHGSKEAISTYLEEHTHLNRKSFDTMEAFITKVHYLCNKLDSASNQ